MSKKNQTFSEIYKKKNYFVNFLFFKLVASLHYYEFFDGRTAYCWVPTQYVIADLQIHQEGIVRGYYFAVLQFMWWSFTVNSKLYLPNPQDSPAGRVY